MYAVYYILIFSLFLRDVICNNIKPRLIHISLGNTESSMIIMWSTSDKVGCSVRYDIGTDFRLSDIGNISNQGNVSSVPGKISQLKFDSWKALQFIHRAELQDLQENQTYFYLVLCQLDEDVNTSNIYSFKTLHSSKNLAVKMLVYGDMGSVSGQKTVPVLQEELANDNYIGVLHVGDFGYNLESYGGLTGDEFFELIQPIAARYPYMTSPGNHELANDMHHYRTRFSMPGVEWPMPLDKQWYSFDVGPVHFISFSTEVFFIHNQDYTCLQYDWLLKDLQTANRNRDKTPWIIAMGHRPMYCSNSNLDDCTPHFSGQWVKRGLEDLFYGMGVDLVIEAHEHSYERLWPVYRSDVVQHSYINPRAPVHVISGAGGNNEGVDWMGNINKWSAFRADKRSRNSYGRLSVVNKTHLHFDQVSAITREVLDQFWVVQEDHGPLISNIDCNSNATTPSICSCPPPFHYTTVLISGSVALFVLIAASITACCLFCKCCRNCCTICACFNCFKLKRRYSFSRMQFRHQPFINTENVDTDEEMGSYWASYSIDPSASDSEFIIT